jgi:hypothetical protein
VAYAVRITGTGLRVDFLSLAYLIEQSFPVAVIAWGVIGGTSFVRD